MKEEEKREKSIEQEQTTRRLPTGLKDRLQQEADRRGITRHDLIVFILWKELQHTVPE